jgi:DNA (cytosine-5)-methyltransferase 1
MRELALFAGSGGGILGGKILGWQTVCAVEIDPFCRRILMQRQDEGILPPFPIWPDVRTFDGRPWAGLVDVISGGFPCQDISAAGSGIGISGERSGLWSEMARIIREVRPAHVLVENSPMLTSRGLDRVLGDLAELRYDARWGVFSAAGVGAPHLRKRIWIRANANGERFEQHSELHGETERSELQASRRHDVGGLHSPMADANRESRHERRANNAEEISGGRHADRSGIGAHDVANASGGRCGEKEAGEIQQPRRAEIVGTGSHREPIWWATEPDVGRVAHGVAARVDRLRAIGNGQVPAVVARAWRALAP